jgi:hypothetical protein
MTRMDELGERALHRLQLGDLGFDLRDVRLGEFANVGAGAAFVGVEGEQLPAFLD